MKKIILLLCLITQTMLLKAQFLVPSYGDVATFKSRTLLVVLPDTVSGEGKALYPLMKENFPKIWNFTKEYTFVTQKEADEKTSKAPSAYAYVMWSRETIEYKNAMARQTTTKKNVLCLIAGFKEKNKMKKIALISHVQVAWLEYDYIFAMQHLNTLLDAGSKKILYDSKEFWDIDKNLDIISKKTLYLPEELIDLDPLKIPKNYPSKFLISNVNAINNAVKDRNKDVLYMVAVIHEKMAENVFIVVDAETGQIVGVVGWGGAHFGWGFMSPDGGTKVSFVKTKFRGIKMVNLKYIPNKSAQKQNH